MAPLIESRKAELAALCARRRVLRLAVFGSAAGSAFRPGQSDVDFLVEFQPMTPPDRADSYFGLLQDLERLLGLSVDLVEDCAIRNPCFRESVEATKVVLYDAA